MLHTSPRRGWTLVDLMIVLVMLVLCLGAIVPAVADRSRETANRVKCASNLRQIGQAILLYANENRGELPRVRFDPEAPPVFYTGANAPDPFGADGPAANDITAALYLLIRTQDLGSAAFICPSAWQEAFRYHDKTYLDFSNFPDGNYLSFSLANLYWADPPPLDQLDAEFAVAADINPGTPQLLMLTVQSPASAIRTGGNSPNHEGDGQNVLFADGHVTFENNPFVGIQRDNIYTYGPSGNRNTTTGGTGIIGMPIAGADSVLLPIATAIPPTPLFSAPADHPIVFWVGLAVMILVISAIVILQWPGRAGQDQHHG